MDCLHRVGRDRSFDYLSPDVDYREPFLVPLSPEEEARVDRLDAILDNLTDGIGQIESKKGWKWTEVLADLGVRVKTSYSDHDIAKVVGGNALRVMKEVWE